MKQALAVLGMRAVGGTPARNLTELTDLRRGERAARCSTSAMAAMESPDAPQSGLTAQETRLFRAVFVIAALWNFSGSLPGLIDPAGMFAREFGRALSDPVHLAIYRGAWVTSLLYGLGFLAVARNLARHSGIVAMGGLGKALFAGNLAYMHLNGWTSPFAVLVIVGDIVFVAAFIVYFLRLRRHGIPLL